MLELKETIEYMISDDYKKRFIAEYYQLNIRITKLDSFIRRIEIASFLNEEVPKHDCPIWILKSQLSSMIGYRMYLRTRAEIENISLDFI